MAKRLWMVRVRETFRRTVEVEVEAETQWDALHAVDAGATYYGPPLDEQPPELVDWDALRAWTETEEQEAGRG